MQLRDRTEIREVSRNDAARLICRSERFTFREPFPLRPSSIETAILVIMINDSILLSVSTDRFCLSLFAVQVNVNNEIIRLSEERTFSR